jgi:predicted phosphate transport protein (TIGR00153 family)
MLRKLLPRETSFFDYFEQHAELTLDGATEFLSLVSSGVNIEAKARRIKEIEHETDVITHRCVEALHKTVITPMDSTQIHRLITRMDDVMDAIEAAAERIALYKLRQMTPEVQAMADVIKSATQVLLDACRLLRNVRDPAAILKKCVDINRLENEADAILRCAVARLFDQEEDAVMIIKWKEIYESLETAADRCEDVANIIENVILDLT